MAFSLLDEFLNYSYTYGAPVIGYQPGDASNGSGSGSGSGIGDGTPAKWGVPIGFIKVIKTSDGKTFYKDQAGDIWEDVKVPNDPEVHQQKADPIDIAKYKLNEIPGPFSGNSTPPQDANMVIAAADGSVVVL